MKILYFDKKKSLKFAPKESNWQPPNTGLDNGLVPNRRQAIIWTNADPFHWRMYVALGGGGGVGGGWGMWGVGGGWVGGGGGGGIC